MKAYIESIFGTFYRKDGGVQLSYIVMMILLLDIVLFHSYEGWMFYPNSAINWTTNAKHYFWLLFRQSLVAYIVQLFILAVIWIFLQELTKENKILFWVMMLFITQIAIVLAFLALHTTLEIDKTLPRQIFFTKYEVPILSVFLISICLECYYYKPIIQYSDDILDDNSIN